VCVKIIKYSRKIAIITTSRATKGSKYILSIVDAFSKYVSLYPCTNVTADEYIRVLLLHIGTFGIMKELRSDGGSQFTAEISKEVSEMLQFKHIIITAYHPQANGLVERRNAEVIKHLRAIIFEKRVLESWSMLLPLVQRILNSITDSSIGTAPARVIFGSMMPLHDDFIVKTVENLVDSGVNDGVVAENIGRNVNSMSEYIVQLNEQLVVIQNVVRNVLHKRNERYKQRIIENQKPGDVATVGDYCLLSYPERPVHKLAPVWRGPYLIIDKKRDDLLVIRNLISLREVEVHVERIKLFYPPTNVLPADLLRWAASDVEEFVIESIITHRGKVKKKSEMEFLVHWQGYDSSYDSWEPYAGVRDTVALEDYAKRSSLKI
jgi:hypothetical protein